MVNLRIQGQNIYMRPMLSADMPALRTAMTGVWPGDIVPTENEGKAFFYEKNVQNETLFNKRNLTGADKGWINLSICKNDNTVIGFQTLKYRGTKVIAFMTAIIPTERGNSYYKEMHALRHKFIFDSTGLNASHSRVTLPSTSTTINDPVIHTNSSLYTSTERTVVFANSNSPYDVKEITQAQWTAWIDHSNQAALKAHTYTLTWTAS